jgi:hypothetical protein
VKGAEWLGFLADLPEGIRSVVQGLLPVVMLAALMAILPMILRVFAKKSGAPSESAIQAYVFGTNYAYQVMWARCIWNGRGWQRGAALLGPCVGDGR